jgi:hypothetical protein
MDLKSYKEQASKQVKWYQSKLCVVFLLRCPWIERQIILSKLHFRASEQFLLKKFDVDHKIN